MLSGGWLSLSQSEHDVRRGSLPAFVGHNAITTTARCERPQKTIFTLAIQVGAHPFKDFAGWGACGLSWASVPPKARVVGRAKTFRVVLLLALAKRAVRRNVVVHLSRGDQRIACFSKSRVVHVTPAAPFCGFFTAFNFAKFHAEYINRYCSGAP